MGSEEVFYCPARRYPFRRVKGQVFHGSDSVTAGTVSSYLNVFFMASDCALKMWVLRSKYLRYIHPKYSRESTVYLKPLDCPRYVVQLPPSGYPYRCLSTACKRLPNRIV